LPTAIIEHIKSYVNLYQAKPKTSFFQLLLQQFFLKKNNQITLKYLKINTHINIVFTVVCVLLINSVAHAQDPIFSLQQTSPMNYNPAHVGNTDFTRAIVGYRNQYPAFSNAFTTYTASFDTYFDKFKSGVGLSVMHDKMAKIFNETTISGAYSFNLMLSENTLIRAGLQASYRFQSQDPGGLIFPDMINSNGSIIPNPFPYNGWNSGSFDVGAGLALMVGPLKVGASAFNFSGKKRMSHNGIKLPDPLRLHAYASYDIILTDFSEPEGSISPVDFGQMSISPGIQYMQQYGYQTLNIGAFFKAGSLFIGLHERQDINFESITIVLSTGIEIDRFGLGISGDISRPGSPSNALTSSAFEVNLSIKLWENKECSSSGRSARHRGSGRGFIKSSGGMRVENSGIDKTRVRRYRCPY
jgi:type IX secretion system PorP/SprF family membrane protein